MLPSTNVQLRLQTSTNWLVIGSFPNTYDVIGIREVAESFALLASCGRLEHVFEQDNLLVKFLCMYRARVGEIQRVLIGGRETLRLFKPLL